MEEINCETKEGEGTFTRLMKKKVSLGVTIILLIISWSAGYIWRGIVV